MQYATWATVLLVTWWFPLFDSLFNRYGFESLSNRPDLARAKDAWICPMIDARRMEVYCALYDAEGKAQTAVEAKIMEEGAFAEELAERKILFVILGLAGLHNRTTKGEG